MFSRYRLLSGSVLSIALVGVLIGASVSALEAPKVNVTTMKSAVKDVVEAAPKVPAVVSDAAAIAPTGSVVPETPAVVEAADVPAHVKAAETATKQALKKEAALDAEIAAAEAKAEKALAEAEKAAKRMMPTEAETAMDKAEAMAAEPVPAVDAFDDSAKAADAVKVIFPTKTENVLKGAKVVEIPSEAAVDAIKKPLVKKVEVTAPKKMLKAVDPSVVSAAAIVDAKMPMVLLGDGPVLDEKNQPLLRARAKLMDADGNAVGSAILQQANEGVVLRVFVSSLPAGEHGMHFHAVGQCDGADSFTSAGGHVAHGKAPHGYFNADGPHAGNLPNLIVSPDGMARVELYSHLVSLKGRGGKPALMDVDGAVLVIHANKDDHFTQPVGGAGERIACGVIQEVVAKPATKKPVAKNPVAEAVKVAPTAQ